MSDKLSIFEKLKALPKLDNSWNAATICCTAYTPPAAPRPARADCTRLILDAKSARALPPSRNPEYKSLDTVVVAKFSRLAFNAFVFASRDVK